MSLTPRLDRLDKNYIINGNFDYWQRGTSTTSDGVYTADRFLTARVTGTYSVTRSTDVPDFNSTYSLSIAATGCTVASVYQRIESVFAKELVGKNVTLQFKVKVTDTTNTPLLALVSYANIIDDFTSRTTIQTTTLNASPTNNGWQTYTMQVSMPAPSANGVHVVVYRQSVGAANTTTLYSQMQLMIGEFDSMEFSKAGRDMAEELALCQRYYEKSYDINTDPGSVSGSGALRWTNSATAISAIATAPFKVYKRAIPTVTVYSSASGAANNIRNQNTSTDVSGQAASVGYAAFTATTSAVGAAATGYGCQWVADAEL